ncbi:MAG: transglutaminase family protein [Gemmatimonadaceae bacterium]|nr:transglutaminase family protein [Acetobacteraceae bacterium]
MRLRIRHETTYGYADPVELAAHMVHLRPRSLPWQRVHAFVLRPDPAPSRLSEGTDHFGNPVTWLFLGGPHSGLHVATEADVTVVPRLPPDPPRTLAWERVVDLAQRPAAATEAAEFAFGSAMAPADAAVRIWCAPSFPPGRPVLAGLLDLMARIGREFRFQPGVTTVSTPITRVLQLRAGVCQDFAHLMIGGLRALGLPARYVSGYVRTRPAPGQMRILGADQSHAWVGCWLGPDHGWIDLDPTNDLIVADEHVVLGWGRDYADVSPLYGVLLGGGAHTLKVSVDMEPLDDTGLLAAG